MKITGIFVFILFYVSSFAQQASKESESVKKLLSDKAVLLNKKQSTRSTDLKLFQEGYLPSALITRTKTNQGNQVYFELFRDYSQSRTSHVEPRLKAMFPNLQESKIDFTNQTCNLTFSPALSDEDLDKLVKVFSYNGYTIKK
ncbi:MAG: hypothetical protein K0S33_4168 [Bacteroidetes bacterium]|jgi:hypothetical protein|nr:hypothetical protein [Bacteroidota bacterium]